MSKKSLKKTAFAAYCAVMLWLLFHRAQPDTTASDFSYWAWVANNINLRPFHTIRLFLHVLLEPQGYIDRLGLDWYAANRQHAIVNLGGNVLMFLPLGFFPPQIWPKLQRLWKTLCLAAIIMCAVEIAQVLTLRGNCDIDDLLLNLAGVAMGYGLFQITPQQKKGLSHKK